MQVAIIDYCLQQITIFDLPPDVDTTNCQAIAEYVENLPGYDAAWCYYMTAPQEIDIRKGKQSDFPEFNV